MMQRYYFSCNHVSFSNGFWVSVLRPPPQGLSVAPKKLLTNNKDIVKYPFYNHDNIFVLGEEDVDTIKDWIDIPYDSSVYDCCKDYSVKSWYNKMQIETV